MLAGGIGFIIFAGLAGAGIYASLEESGIHESIQSANDTMGTHAGEEMPPTADVLKDLKVQLKEYENNMQEVSAFFAPFKEASIVGAEDGQAFQNTLKQERDVWLELCKSKNVVVKNEASWMGFDAYRASAPHAKAAPLLSFEKLGIEYFLSELAKSGATTISSIYRAPLEVEKIDTAKSGDKSGVRNAKKTGQHYIMMPFEVAFTGDRQSVASLLNALTSSDKYFFTVNAIRVKNEKQALPVVAAPKAVVASSPLQSIGLALETKVDEKKDKDPVVAEEILKPLIGSEKVQVRIAANLVFFLKTQEAAPKSE